MKLIVFENETWLNLTPLSYTRPVFELRCGMYTLLERIMAFAGTNDVALFVRDYLVNLTKKNYPFAINDFKADDDVLIVDGRYLAENEFKTDKETIYLCEGEPVYAFVKKENAVKLENKTINEIIGFIKTLPSIEIDAKLMRFPWNLVHYNGEMLKKDFARCKKSGVSGIFSPHAVVQGSNSDLYIAEGAEIQPCVVIDTTSGPVYIDKNAKIFPFSRIEGPCYIGKDSQIMPGASIREGNTIGPVCRVGGEVEESIFQGYSNKYHDGFIGHAYIGEFVNLGALTTNSDLKNDYSSVSVYVNGKIVDTGDLKVGSFIGDHTKTSIGTLFNTGTSVGVMCNITAGGILPKFFPSFVWYVNNKFMKGFGLEMMLQTARAAMERRKKVLSEEEENVIRKVYEITTDLRKAYISKSLKMKS